MAKQSVIANHWYLFHYELVDLLFLVRVIILASLWLEFKLTHHDIGIGKVLWLALGSLKYLEHYSESFLSHDIN